MHYGLAVGCWLLDDCPSLAVITLQFYWLHLVMVDIQQDGVVSIKLRWLIRLGFTCTEQWHWVDYSGGGPLPSTLSLFSLKYSVFQAMSSFKWLTVASLTGLTTCDNIDFSQWQTGAYRQACTCLVLWTESSQRFKLFKAPGTTILVT